jgi:predicted GH43/DUF377 family glycosyl hydrolase
MYENGLYKMWYSGHDQNVVGHNRIGYATSEDGIHWDRSESNPVLNLGVPGSFDDDQVLYPYVRKVGGIYHMYYVGMKASIEFGIGHAISEDGEHWERDNLPGNKPVLTPGDAGEWDNFLVNAMAVLHDGGYFNMWYSGSDASNLRIGFARSSDGLNWVKDKDRNPVLNLGSPGSWDDNDVYQPTVFEIPGHLKMWYTGRAEATYADQVGHATREWTNVASMGLNAMVHREGILLRWRPIRADRVAFILERSDDGRHYSEVLGTGEGPEVHTFLDRTVERGKIYWYNLKAKVCGTIIGQETVRVDYVSGTGETIQPLRISPNPINPEARIEYKVFERSSVKLTVYNTRGEKVTCLVNQIQDRGTYVRVWHGRDDGGRSVSSGIYYCVLEEGNKTFVKKMILLK